MNHGGASSNFYQKPTIKASQYSYHFNKQNDSKLAVGMSKNYSQVGKADKYKSYKERKKHDEPTEKFSISKR
jgi:hypothetical protein